VREIKVNFARFYNKRHGRKGYFWGDRFKSVIVENGETLINCLAYIDLNPVRAGIIEKPEDYRWNSLGYHLQTNNADGFLSTDFGLKEFGVKREKERVRLYRKYVYEAGEIVPSNKPYDILPQTHTDTHRKRGVSRWRSGCGDVVFFDEVVGGWLSATLDNLCDFNAVFQNLIG
jgi:putative transposase